MRLCIFFTLLATGFASCKKQPAPEPVLPCFSYNTVVIDLNNCSQKDTTPIFNTVCFNALEDSRCPANSTCVWEGVAIGKFSLHVDSKDYPFSLATKKFPGSISTDTTIAGYQISLIDILPHPGTGTQPVRAVLQIR